MWQYLSVCWFSYSKTVSKVLKRFSNSYVFNRRMTFFAKLSLMGFCILFSPWSFWDQSWLEFRLGKFKYCPEATAFLGIHVTFLNDGCQTINAKDKKLILSLHCREEDGIYHLFSHSNPIQVDKRENSEKIKRGERVQGNLPKSSIWRCKWPFYNFGKRRKKEEAITVNYSHTRAEL